MRLKFCRAPPRTRGLTTSRSIVQRKDWLALVAVHSDAWLMAVAFYYGAKFDGKERCEKRRLQASRRLVFHRFVALRGNSSPLGPPASELTVVEPPNRARREKLFKHINSLPTVYEILSGKAVNKPKAKAKGAAAGQVSASPTTAFSPFSPLPAVCFSRRRRRDARRATSMPTRPL